MVQAALGAVERGERLSLTTSLRGTSPHMAAFKDFEEIVAWQRAIDLSASVYPCFQNHRDFGFRDQILRATVSVANNIAEGFSSGSNRKFRYYLTIARSSCNEVRSMVILAGRIGYLKQEEVEQMRTECIRLNGTILSLIKSMREDYIQSWAPWLVPFASWVGWV